MNPSNPIYEAANKHQSLGGTLQVYFVSESYSIGFVAWEIFRVLSPW